MASKMHIIGPTRVLLDGQYITSKKTKINRWRVWLAFKVYLWLIPKATEFMSIKTTTGVTSREHR